MRSTASPQEEQSPSRATQTIEDFYLELEPADVNTIIYSVADQLLPMVRSRDQSLTLNLTPLLPEIRVDSLRIEQVLLNLLSNATKFTPPGGSIVISTNENDSSIVIEVQDSSKSIPPEEKYEVFQPHYRLRNDTDMHLPEIGLGLALCKLLVELHGGRIWVESNQNSGNTFAFALPLGK